MDTKDFTHSEREAVSEFLVGGPLRDEERTWRNGNAEKRFSNRRATIGRVVISPCGKFLGLRGENGKIAELLAVRAPNDSRLCVMKEIVDGALEELAGRVRLGGDREEEPRRGRANDIRAISWVGSLEDKKVLEECKCPHPKIVEAIKWLTETMV